MTDPATQPAPESKGNPDPPAESANSFMRRIISFLVPLLWILVSYLIITGTYLLIKITNDERSAQEVIRNIMASSNFYKGIELFGVITSFAITLCIYWICLKRGWLDQIPSERHVWLYLAPVIATVVTGILCIVSIGGAGVIETPGKIGPSKANPSHLAWITAYFFVFIVWDLAMWKTRKKGSGDVVSEMEKKAEHWLLYVDLPTPLMIWAAYGMAVWFGHKDDCGPFISGTIAAILLAQGWGWYLDCYHFARNRVPHRA